MKKCLLFITLSLGLVFSGHAMEMPDERILPDELVGAIVCFLDCPGFYSFAQTSTRNRTICYAMPGKNFREITFSHVFVSRNKRFVAQFLKQFKVSDVNCLTFHENFVAHWSAQEHGRITNLCFVCAATIQNYQQARLLAIEHGTPGLVAKLLPTLVTEQDDYPENVTEVVDKIIACNRTDLGDVLSPDSWLGKMLSPEDSHKLDLLFIFEDYEASAIESGSEDQTLDVEDPSFDDDVNMSYE